MAINRIPRLFPWLCASLPLEPNTAHRNAASREPQSSLPLASKVVHHKIKELWVAAEIKGHLTEHGVTVGTGRST